MSKKEKICIGCLIGVLLVVFAVALALDVKRQIFETKEMEEEIYRNPGTPRDIEKVKIKFKRGTLTPNGATIIIYDDNEYHFSHRSDEYSLQKREDDKWKAVDMKKGYRTHPEYYLVPSKENPIERNINWSGEYEYIELTEGIYRLTKEMKDENDGHKKYEKYLYFQVKEMIKFDMQTRKEIPEFIAYEITQKEAEETVEENEVYCGIGIMPGTDVGGEAE